MPEPAATLLDRAPENPWFAWWARALVRFRWAALALTLVLTALCVREVTSHLRVDTSVEAFLATDSEAYRLLESMRDDFGRDEMFAILVEGDVFSEAFLSTLAELHRELAAIDVPIDTLGERKRDRDARRAAERRIPHDAQAREAKGAPRAAPTDLDDAFESFGEDAGWGSEGGGSVVDEVVSLVNVRRTRFEGGALHVGGLLDEWPSADALPELRRQVLADPALVGRIVDRKARHTALLVRTHFMSEDDSSRVYAEILRVAARRQTPAFRIRVAGLPALAGSINDLMLSDLARMAGAAVVFTLLMMALVFRHPLGVVGPVLSVVLAVVWTFGAMAFFGVPLTMVCNILPAFIICIGVANAVHIQSVYRDQRRAGMENHRAIVHAVATTGIPAAFSSLTTALGLLSFRFTAVDAIQDFGTFAAAGVTLALAHTLVLVPVVLSFNTKSLLGARPEQHGRDRIDALLAFCDRLSRSRAGRSWTHAGALLCAALAIAGTLRLTVYHNPIAWIPEGYPIKDAFDAFDQHLGGTAELTLLVEARPGHTLKDRDLLLRLQALEKHIRAYRHPTIARPVSSVISILDPVRESHRALHEGKAEAYAVPADERGVVDVVTLFESAAPDDLRRLVTIDMTRAVMTARVRWMDASSYRPLVEYIERGIQRHVGDRATISVTGAAVNLLTVVGGLIEDQIRSFGAAFLVVTFFIVVLVRDLRLGFIALLPNLLPTAMVMGFMGFVGIPIDLSNVLIASVALAISDDDTIHFMHHFRAHVHAHGDVDAAIDHAIGHAGRAIVTTGVILAAGFLVFLAADMYNVQRFGLLVVLHVLIALFAEIVLAPALLRTFYASKAARWRTPPSAVTP